MPKRGITLLHRSGVANPQIGKTVFHVEHGPIHPPTPTKTAFLHELVNTGIDEPGPGKVETAQSAIQPLRR